MNPLHLVLTAAAVAALGVAYGPLLYDFGEDLWAKPHYQHFPFVLLAAGLLFATRLAPRPPGAPGRSGSWLAVAAFVAAWGLLVVAYAAPSPMLAAVSLILLLGGWGLRYSRQAGTLFPLGPWLLLWLVIPPPLNLDRQIMGSLQLVSSRVSSYALDLLGVNHLMDGNALVLPDKQLFIDEACSGIISVVSIAACAAMYGVWRRRGGLHTVLLIALAIGWAMLLNVVRIVSIALAWVYAEVDWAEGLSHTTLGLVVFGLSLIVLVANDWLLKAALAEIGPRWRQLTAEPIRLGAWLVSLRDRFATSDHGDASGSAERPPRWGLTAAALSFGLIPTVAFAGLGASQGWLRGEVIPLEAKLDIDQFLAALQDDAMPNEVAGLRLVSVEHDERTRDSQFGKHSIVYEYVDDSGGHYLASCDFPFVGGWHELAECYTGIGWRLNDREVFAESDETGPFEFAQMDLTKPDGRRAAVTYSACRTDGDAIRPPRLDFANLMFQALQRNRELNNRRQSIQIQVLVERIDEVREADLELATRLHHAARRAFIETVRSTR